MMGGARQFSTVLNKNTLFCAMVMQSFINKCAFGTFMLSETEIKEILVKQRETILNKKYGVERAILTEVESKLKLPHVVVLTGLRRSGKSTLLRQLIKKHYHDEDFYYLNFEDERLFDFPASKFNQLYEGLVGLYGQKKIFFLDEIQNVTHFETFVRRFYEEGFKFIITGSSATLLSRELGTKLTGRHVDIVVRPFSFLEFLKLKEVKLGKEAIYKTETKIEIEKYFEEYFLKGGMPEFLIYNDPELLTRVYDDTVIKDIVARYKIKNVVVLKQLYSYLINNFTNKFSYNSLKKFISINSVNTFKKFIFYLEETYFAKTINKFDYSFKKQIMNDKKLYLLDNGFIGVLSKKITPDYGGLLENLVLNCLNKDNDVFYYSGEKECDFLTVRNKEVTQAIQVCYELNQGNRDREMAGLTEAMNKFQLKEGLLLTNKQEEKIKIGGKKIVVKPVWKWLLEN
jgi:predicted AAA+ superfamily ATPase